MASENTSGVSSEVVVSDKDKNSSRSNVTSGSNSISRQSSIGRSGVEVEKDNLVSVFKLVIKELIDSALTCGRNIDRENAPLQQFFIVLEHIFTHGLIKGKKGLLAQQRRDFWSVLECMDKLCPEASSITMSVKEMPDINTPLGRARAWLRLALMQKALADYFSTFVDHKEVLCGYYEPDALMMGDESMVVAGLLVGLNVIDFNLCLKEEDLDSQSGVIDFSLYMRKTNSLSEEAEVDQQGTSEESGEDNMKTVLDQKNYLEELNRHLRATVTDLQQKLESVQASNVLVKEDAESARSDVMRLEAENMELRRERDFVLGEVNRKLEINKADIDVERETYQTSRQGLEFMYSDAKKRMDDETNLRLEVEKELQSQISMKTEMEMAAKLLEQDIHEKQDTIVSLRQQMEDIKALNLEMYNKLQSSEQTIEHKTEVINQLEQKTNEMAHSIRQLESRCKQSGSDKEAAEETARKVGQQLADKDLKRSQLEAEVSVEREMRMSVQAALADTRRECEALRGEVGRLEALERQHEDTREQNLTLRDQVHVLEGTLAEMGVHLSESKLKADEVSEQLKNKEASYVWTSDKDATECKQCQKPFNVKRRKHHCRNCGDIFCHNCSDGTWQLPSSARPVRVCDSCHTALLERASSTVTGGPQGGT